MGLPALKAGSTWMAEFFESGDMAIFRLLAMTVRLA
jgi:hypothetical protein